MADPKTAGAAAVTPRAALNDSLDELDPELVKRLKDEHGEIGAVKTKAGIAVFRAPRRVDHKKFMAEREKSVIVAQENYAKAACVHPEVKVLDQWFDRYPVISAACANMVLELGGLEDFSETKKFE